MDLYSLSPELRDLLTTLDEAIEVPAKVDVKRPADLDPRLHDYQVQAVQHIRSNARAGLFLEMGLGKTATVLQALQPHHLPVLVIAPKRVAENVWREEANTWRPDLTLRVAAYSPTRRREALESDADIVAIGRDNLKDVPLGRFKTIVLDELSSFKTPGSQRTKLARKICAPASYVWGLTGTPAPNGLLDLWSQIFLLDKGARLGRTLGGYRGRFFRPGRQLPNGVVTGWEAYPGSYDKITGLISDLALSMRAIDHLDLPPVLHNTVSVPLDAKAKKLHDRMLGELVAELDAFNGVVAPSVAVAMNKCQQVTAGFIYTETGETIPLHSGKVDALREIVDGTGSPVLVFYAFTAERDAILRAIPEARTVEEAGILDEWNRGEVAVMLAHPASAGHGLNLQRGGHTIVWTSLTYNLEYYEQANARLARQGQKNTVVIHHLEAPGSIDEAVRARVADKASLQAAVMKTLRRGEQE